MSKGASQVPVKRALVVTLKRTIYNPSARGRRHVNNRGNTRQRSSRPLVGGSKADDRRHCYQRGKRNLTDFSLVRAGV